jgi:hypothetical protein
MCYWLKWRVALLLFKVMCLARVLVDLQTLVYSIIITLALLNYISISNKEYHRLSTDVTQCRLEGLENQPNISDDTSFFFFFLFFPLNSTEQ